MPRAHFTKHVGLISILASAFITSCDDEESARPAQRAGAGSGGTQSSTSDSGTSGSAGSAGASGSSGATGTGGASGMAGSGGSSTGTGGSSGSSATDGSTESSTTGGTAGADAGALAVTGPLNKTLLEGTDATFTVTGSAGSLVYQWQRQPPAYPFADIPGETASMLTLHAVPLSYDRSFFRAVVSDGASSVTSRSALLSVIPLGSGALVSLDAGAAQKQDPVRASWTAAGYAGSADLAAGTLASSASAPDGQIGASAKFSVRLYNNSGKTITLAAGSLRAHVESSYVASNLYGLTSLITNALVSAAPSQATDKGGDAGIIHQISVSYANGNPATSLHDVHKSGSTGSTVEVLADSLTALSVNLVLPEIVLSDGTSLWVFASLTTGAAGGTIDSDSPPMTVTFTVPPGVSFDTNAKEPLAWVRH